MCRRAAATDLQREKRCASSQWKRIQKGRRRAKRVNRLRKMNSVAQKLTMTGLILFKSTVTQGASTAQVNAMCRNLKKGYDDGQNPGLH